MKNILLFALTVFAFSTSYGQEKFAEYGMEYFPDDNYEIQMGELDQKGNFSVWIYIESSKAYGDDICIFMDSDKLQLFKSAIIRIKDKYVEWKQVAIDNNVSKATKKFDIKIPYCKGAFIYGMDWHFDFSVGLSARFLVLEDGHYLMIIDTDEMVASDNEFMTAEGYIVFSTEAEVETFLTALDEDKMRVSLEQKARNESLFN